MQLISFRVANFRCFRDEAILSLEPANRSYGLRGNLSPREDGRGDLLRSVLIYGANGSGKTTFLDALYQFRCVVERSHESLDEEKPYSIIPFGTSSASDLPTEMELAFMLDEVRYRYGLVLRSGVFKEEWLIGYPKRAPVTYFHIKDGGRARSQFSDRMEGRKKSLLSNLREDSLLLSSGAANGHEFLGLIRRSLLQGFGFTHTWATLRFRPLHTDALAAAMHEDKDLHGFVEALLQEADTGIEAIEIRKVPFSDWFADQGAEAFFREDVLRKIRDAEEKRAHFELVFHHRGREGPFKLSLIEQSHGTLALLDIALGLFTVLRDGLVFVTDELGGHLHEDMAASIVNLFHSARLNPKGAQLIAATHSSGLLDIVPLRADQVWITQKNEFGETELYPASDTRPRQGLNLRKLYRRGHFGGVPVQATFEF